jgi:hypothetical protein
MPNGKAPSGGNPDAITSIWSTLYEVDFTALPNSGGVYPGLTATIDGKVWSLVSNNAAGNANGRILLTNGTGVILNPTAASGNCGMKIRLGDLVGTDDFAGQRLRMWCRQQRVQTGGTGATVSTNYGLSWWEWSSAAGAMPLTNFTTNQRVTCGHEHETGELWYTGFPWGSNAQTNRTSVNNTDDVFLYEFYQNTITVSSGVWAGGWPNAGALRMRLMDAGVGPFWNTATTGTAPKVLADTLIAFFVAKGDADAAYTYNEVFKNLLIEVAD